MIRRPPRSTLVSSSAASDVYKRQGRKHQLRKQLYAIGNPIFGDTKYKLSNSNKGINKNLMLHSYQIKFKINDIKHTYSALLPDYFKKLLKSKRLRFLNLK